MKIDFPYKNVDFFIVEILKETDQFIYFKVVWYENKKGHLERHEHQCDYDKLEPILIKRMAHCDCTWCSMYGINALKWCIVKKVCALRMVKEGRLDKIVREFVEV